MQKNKKYNIQDITKKIQYYCSIQDRCKWDVVRKMKDWGIGRESIEDIILELEKERFLDEKRFSEAFCRGKFRIKKWGKIKIRKELLMKNIPESLIIKGLQEIEEKDYRETLIDIYTKKKESLKEKNMISRNTKIARHLQQKGFETSLIWELIKEDK